MNTIAQPDKGSMLGGILLVSGCCIGAGMLGLPLVSSLSGFFPSSLMFLVCWAFMAVTGLLLLEVNLWFAEEVSIITMARQTLGKAAQSVTWLLFLFLFYCLMVAYISGAGELFAEFVYEFLGVNISSTYASLFCTVCFGLVVYCGTQIVDQFNRWLMVGLIASYLALVFLGSKHLELHFLFYQNWKVAGIAIPTMIISFGYHNLIPTLTSYLKHDVNRLRYTVLIGSSIPLIIYLIWDAVILGIIPVEGVGGFKEAFDKGDMVTLTLKNIVGSSWVAHLAQYFAFFAMVTSFLGVALSLVDFLADGLKVKKNFKGAALLCSLVLVPPYIFASSYPKVFLMALAYAGGFGAVILFGILPAAMIWVGRYYQKRMGDHLVPGGKALLVFVILFSVVTVVLQFSQEMGWIANQ